MLSNNNHAATAGVSQRVLIYANGTQNGSSTESSADRCLSCLCAGQLMDREIITE